MTAFDAGLAAHHVGDLATAEAHYLGFLASQPNHAEALHMLAVLLHQTGRERQALSYFGQAFVQAPADARLHHNLGETLRTLGRHADAEACFRIAISFLPNFVEALASQGAALAEMGRLDEAIPVFRRALSHAPAHGRSQGNLALALLQSGEVLESLPFFDAAVIANPQDALLQWNRALARLLVSDYEAGLPALEWRWRVPRFPTPQRGFVQPRWRGERFDGRRLLLHAEQGMGDTLQFLRYVPMVAALGGVVALEAQGPLLPLLKSFPGCAELIRQDDPLPPFDLHCPLMSLPEVFATRVDSIPTGPYLRADPARVNAWRARIPASRAIRIGLVWSGNAAYSADGRRSLPPSLLAPLTAAKGVEWFSLQVDRTGPPPFPMTDLAPRLTDFAETAAALSVLDLLITVDTAIAHLAGGMGYPAWVLLPNPPDWRWMLRRDDSPWHPSLRLFRQSRPGDWSSAIAALVDALQTLPPRPPQ